MQIRVELLNLPPKFLNSVSEEEKKRKENASGETRIVGCEIIAHIDMDCFYVQVEQRKQPDLRGLPTAVVQYNSWKGGGLIAVSYEARKFGVKRSMRGDEAKQVCPQIQLVQVPVARGKADLNVYRNAGGFYSCKEGRCERASIDEVYLDLTDAAEAMLAEMPPESLEAIDEEALKSHVLGLMRQTGFGILGGGSFVPVAYTLGGNDIKESVRVWLCRSQADHRDKLLACGALIVAELRMQMLAKLASAMNKPAQQTIVPLSCVRGLLGSLPIKKMKQLGGKLGSSLQSDLGVNTVGDLLQFSEEKLQECYGINTGTWLWNIARGISGEEVESRLLSKSHGSGKTFPGPKALKTIASVENWLNELCEELDERLRSDLEQNKRIAHTLTLHARAYKSNDSDSHKKFPSKSCPLRYGIAKIQEDALNLFQAGLREYLGSCKVKTRANQCSGWSITALSVSASKIVAIPTGTCSIMKYFHGQDLSSSSLKQPQDRSTEEAASLSHSGSESYLGLNPRETQKQFPGEETRINYDMPNLDQQEKKRKMWEDQGTPSILRFFKRHNPTSSLSEQEQVEPIQDTKVSSSSGLWTTSESCSETGQIQLPKEMMVAETESNARRDSSAAKRNDGYKIDDIDCSVMDELPPEIQEEVQARSSEDLNQVQLPKEMMVAETESNARRDSSAAKRNDGYKIDDIDCSVMDELSPEIQEEVQAWSSEELNQVQLPKETMAAETGPNDRRCSLGGGAERRETWSYKIDEIDPSVMDELPPEIRAEVQAWLRPQKPAKTGKRGSSIAHYFSPMKNK
ncbi:DNA polymerase eta [Vitis vinifera]|uniref:DNA polymerase eta n=1 Tax=Vitis vinifera TaxID=29760 RepID=A0A438J0Y5_VITVI|nr:DNA polymerase eta [Vitis vinifera]